MSGNKTDNGVHEVGTDEIRNAYQDDTPGQTIEEYIEETQKELKNNKKKHFSQVFKILSKVSLITKNSKSKRSKKT